MIEIFHSRRTNFNECKYWIRDERTATGTPSQWITYNQPQGMFYARPISAKSNQMQVLNGVWALDENHLTVETSDDVDDLNRGCIVQYRNELWLVESVQRKIHIKESEFDVEEHYFTVISMRRG